MSQLLRTLRGSSTRRPWLTSLAQLTLIGAWHALFFIANARLEEFGKPLILAASRYWYARGVTRSTISDFHTTRGGSGSTVKDLLWSYIAPIIIYMLIEALFGWIAFRFVLPKFRARWYRLFIRAWWRTCLLMTLIAPPVWFAVGLLPGFPSAAYLGFLAIGFWLCMFTIVPVRFARRDVVLRARRICSLCPGCRYWLRDLATDRCPECGTSVTRSLNGGFVIAHRP